MKKRCSAGSETHWWKYYAAKGITISERWVDSFEAFLADMGERPEGKTLDRKNGNLGYSKENCRWATWKEQASNRNPLEKSS